MSRLRIGFPLSRGGGGPTIFMGRLRQAIFEEKIASARYFFDPFADVLLCANAVRNPWRKPYVMRVDGIAFDSELDPNERMSRNSPIFSGIDRSAGVVYQSQFDLELVSSFHKSKKLPATVIPNGVDLSQFRPDGRNMRASLGIPQEDLVFLSSAKWRAHKRLGAIIAAFERFCRTTNTNSHLLILGKLDAEPENIPVGVRFIGHIEPENLPNWYRTADIFLFFSWIDHCPNTVVEALASGLPVVCTNQGGTKELIDITNGGVVVDADEPFNLAEVKLYRPPEPDPNKTLAGILDAVARREQIASSLRREEVGIRSVARRYVDFLNHVVHGSYVRNEGN